MKLLLRQKEKGGSSHFFLFVKVYRLERGPEAVVGTRFDLDENDHAAVKNDQVDLSERASVIFLQQHIAFFLEILLGEPFAFLSERLLLILHRVSELKWKRRIGIFIWVKGRHALEGFSVNKCRPSFFQSFQM